MRLLRAVHRPLICTAEAPGSDQIKHAPCQVPDSARSRMAHSHIRRITALPG